MKIHLDLSEEENMEALEAVLKKILATQGKSLSDYDYYEEAMIDANKIAGRVVFEGLEGYKKPSMTLKGDK